MSSEATPPSTGDVAGESSGELDTCVRLILPADAELPADSSDPAEPGFAGDGLRAGSTSFPLPAFEDDVAAYACNAVNLS